MDILGPLQLRVMKHLWAHGPSTVRAVHDALNHQPGYPTLAYTTVLTVMRNLARRRICSQQPVARSHLFAPLIDQEAYNFSVLRQVRRDCFEGDLGRLLDQLARDPETASDARLQAMRAAG